MEMLAGVAVLALCAVTARIAAADVCRRLIARHEADRPHVPPARNDGDPPGRPSLWKQFENLIAYDGNPGAPTNGSNPTGRGGDGDGDD